jgi:hypothetical protein
MCGTWFWSKSILMPRWTGDLCCLSSCLLQILYFGDNDNICVECHLTELAVPTRKITNNISTIEMRRILSEMNFPLKESTPIGEVVDIYDALVGNCQCIYGEHVVNNISVPYETSDFIDYN